MLRLTFVKFFRASSKSLSQLLRDNVTVYRRKWHCGSASRFHPLITRRNNADFAASIVARNFALTLSRADHVERRPIGAMQPINEIDDEGEEEASLLRNTREIILILARIAIICSVIIVLLAAYLMMHLTHAPLFPTILRKGTEFLGPIFIKFGQWISTRRDIFPQDICDTLSQLQQSTTPHSWLYTKHLLEATYGSSWQDLFVKFDDKSPIGSGCCAQVYKAWIDLNVANTRNVPVTQEPWVSYFIGDTALDKSSELIPTNLHAARKLQAVAVKVLHPGIKGQLKRDIAIMRGLCKCVMYFVPKLQWLSLTDCIDEFARIMKDQVDMRLEASNLMKFSANFSRTDNILFPHPYMHLTHRKILVETFHDGTPISYYLEHDDVVLQRKLAKIGIATVLKMVFKDNFIHCDLHPGNILVEKAVVPKTGLFNAFRRIITPHYIALGPRLIILDCGLVTSLNDRCRRNLRDVFYSVLIGNGEMAAQYILEHSSHVTPDPDGFKRSMKDIVQSHLCDPFNVNVSTVVTELFSAMVRYRVKQDGSFTSVILSMLVIEGLGRHLDPNIDIFMEILPFVVSSTVYSD